MPISLWSRGRDLIVKPLRDLKRVNENAFVEMPNKDTLSYGGQTSLAIQLSKIAALETYVDNGTLSPRDAILLGFSGETEKGWNMFHPCSDTPGKPSTLTFSLVLRSSMCYSLENI